MKYIHLALLAVSLAIHAMASKPNVIVIMADDLGFGDIGCPVTRAVVNAIQDNNIDHSDLEYLEKLNLYVPKSLEGVDPSYLNPRDSWESKEDYDEECSKLCERFKENFTKFDVDHDIVAAGPK